MADITMSTDWGAKGAQLTGAQVQTFIKEQLTANAKAAETNATNIDSLKTKATELTNRMADDKRQVLVWFRNQYGQNAWGSPDQCKNYTQAMGWYAQGIWIERDGLPPLIMSMEQTICPWSSGSSANAGASLSKDAAYADNNGKEHTAEILACSDLIDNQSNDYCATWCNRYSTTGKAAGSWWLPSIGELMTIRRHYATINECLEEMGKTKLAGVYASSNEFGPIQFLRMGINSGTSDYNMVPSSTSKGSATSHPTIAVTTP